MCTPVRLLWWEGYPPTPFLIATERQLRWFVLLGGLRLSDWLTSCSSLLEPVAALCWTRFSLPSLTCRFLQIVVLGRCHRLTLLLDTSQGHLSVLSSWPSLLRSPSPHIPVCLPPLPHPHLSHTVHITAFGSCRSASAPLNHAVFRRLTHTWVLSVMKAGHLPLLWHLCVFVTPLLPRVGLITDMTQCFPPHMLKGLKGTVVNYRHGKTCCK